jgi:hypothetical protein
MAIMYSITVVLEIEVKRYTEFGTRPYETAYHESAHGLIMNQHTVKTSTRKVQREQGRGARSYLELLCRITIGPITKHHFSCR